MINYTPPTKRRKMTRARRVGIFLAHDGLCGLCGLPIHDGEPWDVEHPDAVALGGPDNDAALKPAHVACHKSKTADDRGKIAYRNRVIDKGYAGAGKRKRPMPGSKGSGWRKRMDGTVERRGGR